MIQELNFTKCENGYGYEAFATVNADFAVHLERNDIGNVTLYQTSIEGTEKDIKDHRASYGEVFDEDYDNIVYPKYIRLVSSSFVKKGFIREKEE